MEKYYYQVYLDVVLRNEEHMFGSINISHIPYKKLEELFLDQVVAERFLFDDAMSYQISEKLYKKNKKFFDEEIFFRFDFDLFEYSVSLTGDLMSKYQPDYYSELPPLFKSDK